MTDPTPTATPEPEQWAKDTRVKNSTGSSATVEIGSDEHLKALDRYFQEARHASSELARLREQSETNKRCWTHCADALQEIGRELGLPLVIVKEDIIQRIRELRAAKTEEGE